MPLNLLIVDDSKTVRAMLIKSLRMGDVDIGSIHEAANGREALELLEDNWVDLIFTDINMPEMNGIEFIDKVHENEEHRGIPMVIVSTDTIEARRDLLESKGVRGYVRKPFTPESMNAIVHRIMGEKSDE